MVTALFACAWVNRSVRQRRADEDLRLNLSFDTDFADSSGHAALVSMVEAADLWQLNDFAQF